VTFNNNIRKLVSHYNVLATVGRTLYEILGGAGARGEGTEKNLNLNPGNGICSILRTHFVKNVDGRTDGRTDGRMNK
jgi:hypothetical protein